MALVKKFGTGDKTETPKKVLTYQNVGEYDSDALAAALTQELEQKAAQYSGADRLAFINYGTKMILAIKDGNVTKNVDGSFSITGNYGLNNQYNDEQIALMREKGKVGKGASNYEGQYQKSYGIFTTNGTENFRHNNHMLGLVGRWVSDKMMNTKPIEAKKEETPEAYTFDKAFIDAHLGGNKDNKLDFLSRNKDPKKRAALVAAALRNADAEKWGVDRTALNDLATALENVKDGNFNDILNRANNLGFRLDSYLNTKVSDADDTGNVATKSYDQQLDELVDAWLAKEKVKPENQGLSEATWKEKALNYRNQLIDDDKKARQEAINVLETRHRNTQLLDFANLLGSELSNIQAEETQPIFLEDEVIDLLNTIHDVLSPEQISLVVNSYNSLSDETKELYFSTISEGDYNGWVSINDSFNDDGGLIFNPETGEYKYVGTHEVPGTLMYKYAQLKYLKDHPFVPSNKEGGTVQFMALGDSMHAAILKDREERIKTKKALEEAAKKQMAAEEAARREETGIDPNVDYLHTTEDGFDLSDRDKVRLATVVGDLASMGGGWWSAAGFASDLTNAYLDYTEPGQSATEATNNLLTNLGMSALSLVPTLGTIKAVKGIKGLATGTNIISKLLHGMTVSGVISNALAGTYGEVIDHIKSGNYTTLDLLEATRFLQLAVGYTNKFARKDGSVTRGLAKTSARVRDAVEKAGLQGNGDIALTTKSGKKVNLTPEEFKQIQEAGDSYDAKNAVFKSLRDKAFENEALPVKSYKEKLVVNGKTKAGLGKDATPKEADLPISKRGNLPKSYTAPDDNGVIRTYKLNPITRAVVDHTFDIDIAPMRYMRRMRDQHLPDFGTSRVEGFKTVPTNAVPVQGTGVVGNQGADIVEWRGSRYIKNAQGEYVRETSSAKQTRQNNEKTAKAKKEWEAARKERQQARKERKEQAVRRETELQRLNQLREMQRQQDVVNAEARRQKVTQLFDKIRLFGQRSQAAELRQLQTNAVNAEAARAAQATLTKADAKKLWLKKHPNSKFTNKVYLQMLKTGIYKNGGEFAKITLERKKLLDLLNTIDLQAIYLKSGGIIKAEKGWKVGDKYYPLTYTPPLGVKADQVNIPENYILSNSGEYVPANIWTVTSGDQSYRFNNEATANTVAGFMNGATVASSYEENPLYSANLGYTVGNTEYNNPETAKLMAGKDGKVTVAAAGTYPTFGTLNQAHMELYGEDYARFFKNANSQDRIASDQTRGADATAMEKEDAYKKYVAFMLEYYRRATSKEANPWENTALKDENYNFEWTDANKNYAKSMYEKLQARTLNHQIYKDGNFVEGASKYILGDDNHSGKSEWYDGVLGNYHQYAPERQEENNKYLINEDGIVKQIEDTNGLEPIGSLTSKYYTSDLYGTNTYYKAKPADNNENTKIVNGITYTKNADGKFVDKDGNELPEEKLLSAGNEPIDDGLKWKLNTVPLQEVFRNELLNANIHESADKLLDWDPAHKSYLHRLKLQTGNYHALKSAENDEAEMNSTLGRMQYSDPRLILASRISGKAAVGKNNLNAALADIQMRTQTGDAAYDLVNQDKVYNLGARDWNDLQVHEYGKYRAGIRGNEHLQVGSNNDAVLAWINQLGAQQAAAGALTAIHHNQTMAGIEALEALLLYEKGLIAAEELRKRLSTSQIDADRRAYKIVTPGILGTVSVAKRGTKLGKKGRKLSAAQLYVLQSSKDFNRALLEAAKLFYNSLNKKRK